MFCLHMTLHSTMYLFLLFCLKFVTIVSILYIPQCIYFYEHPDHLRVNGLTLHSTMYLFLHYISDAKVARNIFTFHNVSISTQI